MSKDGRKFFYFSSSFFADRKIKILKARYGADGMILYIYLLCEIYREEGYFLSYDDDCKYIIAAELCMSYEKIGQILNFLLERSLFDDTLFQSDKVLTSREIQATFQEAVKTKALKNPVAVRERLWLLEKNETAAYIQVRPENEYSVNLPSDSKNLPSDSENLPLKQRKAKQSKAAASSSSAAAAADNRQIEEAYRAATGRNLRAGDYVLIESLRRSGVSDAVTVGVIGDVAQRAGRSGGGKINSFRYFLPAIREAAEAGTAEAGHYPVTSDMTEIERILDAETAAVFAATPEEDYDYDE